MAMRARQWYTWASASSNRRTINSIAAPRETYQGSETDRARIGQQIVEGRSLRLVDEARYFQRRAAGRIVVTIGQLILFPTQTGDD
jgi:hypothetical protein